MKTHRSLFLVLLLVLAQAAMTTVASAQGGFLDSFDGGFGGGTIGGDPVDFSAEFTSATDDRPAVVMITATMGPGWHLYSTTQGKLPSGLGPQQTKITLSSSSEYKLLGNFKATPEPKKHVDQTAYKGLMLEEHGDTVTWYAPVEITEGVDPASLVIEGQLRGLACQDEGSCVPQSYEIAAKQGEGVEIGPLDFTAPEAASTPTAADATPSETPSEAPGIGAPEGDAYDLAAIRFAESTGENSLVRNLLLAFGGGLVLNLMPCVLPVIGLKVMSFVQQAGYSRAKALELNVWYSLGIMGVFWVLAVLAISASVSWGEQFSSVGFNLVMAGVVFLMALSLLGVWEIHVPQAVGQSTTHQSVAGEGRLAAFLKGVLTTLLATPCTGPGMAVALGWAVTQPAPTILAVFTALGFGMASPYLLIGAFPSLVSFLPKPGEWMVTFKQLMGFVLLGTVIFLLSLLPSHYLLPSICFMTTLGLAAWIYSKMPIGASWNEHSQTYALCGAIVAASAVFSFAWLAPTLVNDDTEWQAFSLAKLNKVAVEQKQTVLVDFGADWCANCQVLEKAVLHTEPVENAIKRHGVVPMFADNTYYPPEIENTLKALRSNGVPVIAIFPGSAPYEPIVFRGIYTQDQLIEAINHAVAMKAPSVTKTAVGGGSPPNR